MSDCEELEESFSHMNLLLSVQILHLFKVFIQDLNQILILNTVNVNSIKRCIHFWFRSYIVNARVRLSVKSPSANPKHFLKDVNSFVFYFVNN